MTMATNKTANPESGMTLLAVMGIMAVFAIGLLAVAPDIYQEVQREKELETIARGEEVAEAIRQYVEFYRGAKLPNSMKDLLDGLPQGTKKRQILRASAAIDPLTSPRSYLPLQWQGVETAHVTIPLRHGIRVAQLVVGYAAMPFLERHYELPPRQVRPDAGVRARAEGQVTHASAVEPHRARIGIRRLVATRRHGRKEDEVAGFELDPFELIVRCHLSARPDYGKRAQHFLDRVRDDGRVPSDLRSILFVERQVVEEVRQLRVDRVETGEEQVE